MTISAVCVVAVAALLSGAVALTIVDDVCGQTYFVGDLAFTLPSGESSVPSYIYWNVADLSTRYQVTMSNISAFNASGDQFTFGNNTNFSNWSWVWNCSLSCINLTGDIPHNFSSNFTFGGPSGNSSLVPLNANNTNITAAADMCFFVFVGQNGQTGNLSVNLTLTTHAFVEQNGTGVLKFSVQLDGPLIPTLLNTTDILMIGFENECISSVTNITGNATGNVTGNATGNVTGNSTGNSTGSCSAPIQLGDLEFDIVGVKSRSIFTLVNHAVQFMGPAVEPCILRAQLNATNATNTTLNPCGMRSFSLLVNGNVSVVSFEWNHTSVAGFNTIFIDPRIYTIALNATTPPTPPPVEHEDALTCLCRVPQDNLSNLILRMRQLWEDNLMFSRLFTEETIYNITIANSTLTRLRQNSVDLGNNFGLIYCDTRGSEYAQILDRHVDGMIAVLAALMNSSDVQAAQNTSLTSAREFAQFWHIANRFAVADDVYNQLSVRLFALEDLIRALIDANGNQTVQRHDAFAKATRDMVSELVSAIRYHRVLCGVNQCCASSQRLL